MVPAFSPGELADIKQLLSVPQHIVITTHFKPDGDALGASLGLQSVLKSIGHEVITVSPSEFPAFLSWMEGAETVIDYLQNKARSSAAFQQATLVFCLDFNDPARVEGMQSLLLESTAPRILVDHHLDPKPFCTYTFSETKASSTCELILQLLVALDLDKKISSTAAEALYC